MVSGYQLYVCILKYSSFLYLISFRPPYPHPLSPFHVALALDPFPADAAHPSPSTQHKPTISKHKKVSINPPKLKQPNVKKQKNKKTKQNRTQIQT